MTIKHRGATKPVLGYRIIGKSIYCQVSIGAGMTHYIKSPHKPWNIPKRTTCEHCGGMSLAVA